MPRYAYSLDFDGCVANPRFCIICKTWDKFKPTADKPFNREAFKKQLLNELADYRTLNREKLDNQKISKEESVAAIMHCNDITALENFDACFNEADSTLDLHKLLMLTNEALAHRIQNRADKKHPPILFVGSNRQDVSTDTLNAANLAANINELKIGSCFPYFEQFATNIGAELNRVLLTDIYQGLPEGNTFYEALNCTYSRSAKNTADIAQENMTWMFDETKLSILYSQMQVFATTYPDEKLIYEFVDDRQDIREALAQYFTKHPDMIPKNVTLNITPYAFGHVSTADIKTIPGKGPIDYHYADTLKSMANAILSNEQVASFIGVSSYKQAKAGHFNMSGIPFHQHLGGLNAKGKTHSAQLIAMNPPIESGQSRASRTWQTVTDWATRKQAMTDIREQHKAFSHNTKPNN